MEGSESDIPVEDVNFEEGQQNLEGQEYSDEQFESENSLKILVKGDEKTYSEEESRVSDNVNLESEGKEFDSLLPVATAVEKLEEDIPSPDFFYVDKVVESRSSVSSQVLEDVEQISQNVTDVKRYEEYECSIQMEQRESLTGEEIAEYQRCEQDNIDLQEQSDTILEEAGTDLDKASSIGWEEKDKIEFEEESEFSVGEESRVDLEGESEISIEEQSEIGLEDEQSYLSSGEEKTDSDKISEENRKLSLAKTDRQKLIEIYQSLQCKENILLRQNCKLQMKLLARLKALEKREYISIPDKEDIEEKYRSLLGEVEERWKRDYEQSEAYSKEKTKLTLELAEKQQNLGQLKNDLLHQLKQTALVAIDTHTGRRISPEEIEACFTKQVVLDSEVKEARLKYVKERRKLKKLQHLPVEKEEPSADENVQFAQYEELRIASETNQMQLEKLAQELRKMDNVFSSYVQMITHTSEKLLDLEPDSSFDDKSLDDEIIENKELLTRLKQKRNEAAIRLERLRNHYGILSDQNLMRHYDKLQHDLHSVRIKITGIKSDLNDEHRKRNT